MEKKIVQVGIYARVSTDFEEQKTSVEHQVQMLGELALIRGERDNEDWIVQPEHIYEDEDVSGKKVSIMQRPAIQRMMHDIEEGQISVVMFKGISRFSRDQEDGIKLYNRLKDRYRVRVISEEENFDSKYSDGSFWFGFHLLMAQFESDKIATRVSMGLRQKAKNGKWATQTPPYGYDIDKETKKLIPNDHKRKAIETIFHQYVSGKGIRAVAEYMTNETPYQPTHAKMWSAVMVRRILDNEAYLGHVIYNKTNLTVATNDEGIKKPVRHTNDADKIIRVEDAHPPLISQDLYDQVQAKIARHSYNRSLPVAKSPLAGVLRCARCGKPIIRTGNFHPKGHMHQSSNGKMYARRKDTDLRRYGCSTMQNHGKSLCDLPYLKAPDLDRYFYLELMDNLKEYMKNIDSADLQTGQRTVTAEEQRIKQIDKEMEKIVKAGSDMAKDRDLYDPDTFRSILLQYKEDTGRLRHEKGLIEKEIALTHTNEGNKELVKRMIDDAFKVDPSDHDSLRELFQTWYSKIMVHDRGHYEIYPTVHGLGVVTAK